MIKKCILLMILNFIVLSANAAQIIDKNIRHAFWRGEKAVLEYELLSSADELKDATLSLNINDLILMESDAAAVKKFEIDTNKLKSGRYKVICQLKKNDDIISAIEHFIVIARKWNPDRMRVWLWPHRKFGQNVYKLDDEAKRQLDWYADKGFNSFQPGGGVGLDLNYGGFTPDKFALYDYALSKGWEMGVGISDGFNLDINEPAALFKPVRPYFGRTVMTNPYHSAVAAKQNQINENIMQVIQHFPGIKVCFWESEIEDNLISELPYSRQNYDVNTSAHKFIAPGVIADNDEGYVKRLFQYKWGDGLSAANERASAMVHKYRPDIFAFSDPLRRTSVYERFRGTNAISTWTYTHPDPKYMLYIETLIANGKPFNQGVMHTITLLNYPGSVAPENNGWVLMGPDRLVETSWINLSRNPDGLGYYIGSGLDPFNPGYPAGSQTGGVTNVLPASYPYQQYPPTFDALKRFVDEVVIPYGPMIRELKRSPRKTAVLSSESSDVYSASPRLLGHYGNYQAYCFYSLLNMIHIPADIVFDETIAKYGLDDYSVLVLPKCDTLTKTVYDKILDFQRKGGLVVSDQYLRAEIPGAVKFDFDFTYRNNVSAKALIEKKDYAEKTDNETRKAKLLEVKGVTADEDRQTMETYAAKLDDFLKSRIAKEVDCSSPTVLLNMLEKDGVKYLFVINDKRTYDERIGEYKAILEKGISQTAKITLNTDEELYIYDIIEHKELSCSRTAENIMFDVNLPAAGGKIIALIPHKPEIIEINLPDILQRSKTYKFDIIIKDKTGSRVSGVQPLKICITDPAGNDSEFSDYYAATGGIYSLAFTAGLNDNTGKWQIEIENLMTGGKTKRFFEVK